MRVFSAGGRLLLGVAAIGFLGTVGLTSAISPADASSQGHQSPAMVRVTFANGSVRTLKFNGVGCAVSMCSRVVVKSKVNRDSWLQDSTWLDSVAAIQDTTPRDALFVFKDGTQRRLSVIPGNRFLYLANGKVELSKVESVEFLAR